HLFESSQGEYELILKPVDTTEMLLLQMTTEDMTFDGIKSIKAWSRIAKGIGSMAGKLIPSAESGKVLMSLSLTAEEAHLFSLCEKGQFSVDEVCSMSYLHSFDTCRTLFAFRIVGALESTEPVDRPAAASDVPAAPSLDAELDLHDLVEKYNDLYAQIFD